MKVETFVKKLKDIVDNYKTLYIMGCFGAPMNTKNKSRYTKNYAYNKKTARKNKINKASSDTFGFDCVCLIKGILWGWNGDNTKTYGGAKYGSNKVPDTNANGLFNNYCTNKSSDFNKIEVGSIVWMNGHVGVYVGDNKVVECTPIWNDGVQYTNLANIKKSTTLPNRKWSKHGKLKFIEYPAKEVIKAPEQPKNTTTTPKFKVGDRVVPIKLISYNGKKVRKWDKYYYITELKGNRAVLKAKRLGKYYTWSAMNVNNIKKV